MSSHSIDHHRLGGHLVSTGAIPLEARTGAQAFAPSAGAPYFRSCLRSLGLRRFPCWRTSLIDARSSIYAVIRDQCHLGRLFEVRTQFSFSDFVET